MHSCSTPDAHEPLAHAHESRGSTLAMRAAQTLHEAIESMMALTSGEKTEHPEKLSSSWSS